MPKVLLPSERKADAEGLVAVGGKRGASLYIELDRCPQGVYHDRPHRRTIAGSTSMSNQSRRNVLKVRAAEPLESRLLLAASLVKVFEHDGRPELPVTSVAGLQ